MPRALLMVLAVSLMLAAPTLVSAQVEVELPDWCDICTEDPACYSCCRCEGTSPEDCGGGCLTEGTQASTHPLLGPNRCPMSEEIASFEVTDPVEDQRAAVDRFLELLDGRSR